MSQRVVPLVLILFFGSVIYAISTQPRSPEADLASEARADLARRGFKPLSGPLAALVEDSRYTSIPTQVHPLLNMKAPDFSLSDVEGKRWSVRDLRAEGPLVLVFYYGYTCNHCVSQLFGLSKDIDKFKELGARVVAISPDPPSLTKQRYERYGAFEFTVLTDPENKVAELYGAYNRHKSGEGEPTHATFVISREGTLKWAHRGEEPFTQNQTLLIEVNKVRKE